MQENSFDVIVVGLGGHGSSTLAYLAKNHPNLRVLGIEQFSVTHKNGSSHGRSRIYRQAYFEDPAYNAVLDVPLLQRSLELWKNLQSFHENHEPTSSFRPLDLCGGVMIGPPDSEVVRGTLVSIAQHSLPHQILSATEMKERYGVFHLSEEEIGVWESNAGYLHPEVCIETFIALAKQHLANTHYDEKLLSYERVDPTLAESQGMTLQVVTDRGKYHCKKLILTVGAWANEIYGHALPKSFPLTIERRVLFWFEPTEPDNFELHNQFKRMPVYIWDLGKTGLGNFYGFPEQAGYEGIKVAMHHCKDEKPSSGGGGGGDDARYATSEDTVRIA
eukprot:gene13732-15135_t